MGKPNPTALRERVAAFVDDGHAHREEADCNSTSVAGVARFHSASAGSEYRRPCNVFKLNQNSIDSPPIKLSMLSNRSVCQYAIWACARDSLSMVFSHDGYSQQIG